MSNQSGYKDQKNLSAVQVLAEVPTFIESLLSAIFAGALLLYVDLLDSLTYIIRHVMLMFLSKKLTKDLRFEYNYGVEKIEAMASLLCDGIMLFGMFLTLCFSVYSFFFPERPSDLLIAVAGLKLYDILWDLAFYIKQRKIYKATPTAVIKANYAAALATLLFDSLAFISLFAMWLFRDSPIGGYISPIASIGAVIYLTVGCIKRIRTSLNEITDKTLPEEQQLKTLNVLTKHYRRYSQFHSIHSRRCGDVTRIDAHLSFENGTRAEEVIDLKKQMQGDFNEQIGDCVVNIIVEEE